MQTFFFFLTLKETEAIVHAFTSQLDYCDSLCTQKTLDGLQTVQISASMITCFYLFWAILHCLLVDFNIDFKTSLITFKALSSLLADLLIPYLPAHTWRSSGKGFLCVPDGYGAENKGGGDRTYFSLGPEAVGWTARGNQVSWFFVLLQITP